MIRLLVSAFSAGMLSVGCGGGTPTIVSPTSLSSDASAGTNGGLVEKRYTVGGIVQSVEKPFQPLEGARIWVEGERNPGNGTVSGAGGAFSLPLKPGTMTLVVTKDGFEPWSTTMALFEDRPDLRVLLRPTPR